MNPPAILSAGPGMRPSAGESYRIEYKCLKKLQRVASSGKFEEHLLRASSSDG